MNRLKNFVRNINYLTKHALWDQREEDITFLTYKILDDASYEYGLARHEGKDIHILDIEESMDLIEHSGKSFVRTGDGEITLMMGYDHSFTHFNKDIADRLIGALASPPEKLLVGVNRNYFIPFVQKKSGYYARHAYEFREFYLAHCSADAAYIDATCTGLNKSSADPDQSMRHMERWRRMFEGRDIVVICGEGILDGFQYDIFELAGSKTFIYGPRLDAWEQRDEIMGRIRRDVSREQLLVFILGQSGKAMITDLVDIGYTCWDVGHLAKYYNALMTGMEWNKENTRRFYAPD